MATKREAAKKTPATETKKPATPKAKPAPAPKPAPEPAPEPEVTVAANETAPGVTDEMFSDAVNDLNEVLALDPALDDDCNPDNEAFVQAVGLIELTDIFPPNKTDPALKPETVATFKALGFTLPELPAAKGKAKAPKAEKAPKAPKAPKEAKNPLKSRIGSVVKAWIEGKRDADLIAAALANYGDDNEKEAKWAAGVVKKTFEAVTAMDFKVVANS